MVDEWLTALAGAVDENGVAVGVFDEGLNSPLIKSIHATMGPGGRCLRESESLRDPSTSLCAFAP